MTTNPCLAFQEDLLAHFPNSTILTVCPVDGCGRQVAHHQHRPVVGKPQYYRSYLFHMTILFPLSLLMLEYNYMAILI